MKYEKLLKARWTIMGKKDKQNVKTTTITNKTKQNEKQKQKRKKQTSKQKAKPNPPITMVQWLASQSSQPLRSYKGTAYF